MNCPINKLMTECPCKEFDKEFFCDYPHRNTDKEIRAIELWGHRLPYKEVEVEDAILPFMS